MLKILSVYIDGFKNREVDRRLWLIIFIKLFIMFAVLKTFYFPNHLKANFATDQERANHVIDNITSYVAH